MVAFFCQSGVCLLHLHHRGPVREPPDRVGRPGEGEHAHGQERLYRHPGHIGPRPLRVHHAVHPVGGEKLTVISRTWRKLVFFFISDCFLPKRMFEHERDGRRFYFKLAQ